ncbi:MAG: ABC transporter permease [Acidobacteria bacterium]|nr:ABC transporter permease [Acidobacteriota bacterium]
MSTLMQDLRYAVRSLAKNPGFYAVAIIALALGIGANTAIFSVVNAVLLRPLPFKDPDRLVMVWEHNFKRGNARNVVSPADLMDWKAQNRTLENLAGLIVFRTNLSGDGEPEQVSAGIFTEGFFSILDVHPALGRDLTPEELRPGGPDAVLLSYGFWQRRFGGDSKVLGRNIILNGRPNTIVGVLPAGFRFQKEEADVWIPFALNPATDYRKNTGRYLSGVARLKPGVSRDQAQADLAAIAVRLEKEHPEFNTGWGVNVVPLQQDMVGDVRTALLAILGAVGFVLLIACANVANLLLAKAASRAREIAVRTALGASRGRIVAQLLTESVLLSLLGGAAGLLLALWGIELLTKFAPADIPRLSEIRLDRAVLGFSLALSVLTGLLFGLVPALQAARLGVSDSLKDGGRGSSSGAHQRLRSLLVVSEVALSMILLIGAGLLGRSFLTLLTENPGFNSENVLTMRLSLPSATYRQGFKQVQFFEDITARIAGLSGVQSVGGISWLPLGGSGSATTFDVLDRPMPPEGEHPVADVRFVTRDFFRAMGTPLLSGRTFEDRDAVAEPQVPPRGNPTAPAPALRTILVNQALAKMYWPNEDPIGKRLQMDWGEMQTAEIIGVVSDVKLTSLETDPRPTIYWYHQQIPSQFMAVVVRVSGDPLQLVGAIKSQVAALDKNVPVAHISTMDNIVASSVSLRRFNLTLLGVFAGVALLLAAVGIYGVISYSVVQRTHEIGIRMALGAQRAHVLRLVLSSGLKMTAIGLGVGIAGALALTRFIATLLFHVQPADPLTFVGVAALLLGVAVLAALLPARRAARVDPLVALRYE